jgi:hypothetical protein
MSFTAQGFYELNFSDNKSTVYTVEAAILLLICLFYFIELFKKAA